MGTGNYDIFASIQGRYSISLDCQHYSHQSSQGAGFGISYDSLFNGKKPWSVLEEILKQTFTGKIDSSNTNIYLGRGLRMFKWKLVQSWEGPDSHQNPLGLSLNPLAVNISQNISRDIVNVSVLKVPILTLLNID